MTTAPPNGSPPEAASPQNAAGPAPSSSTAPVVRLSGVSLRYGKTLALDNINLEIPSGIMVGLIGPDGVGKSSLMSLIVGARTVQHGKVESLGGDMASAQHRKDVCPKIAYMPQGLGKNLYPTLSIEENLQFFARLFGHGAAERRRRIDELTTATELHRFLARPAGKLSGGMKQKLGLCCSLIHDPELLVLDEPTTGVDPLARSQFWDLVGSIQADRPGMSVMVATAYMDEADRFDWLIAMDAGRVLATGTPKEFRERTGCETLEEAFIALLPEEKKRGHKKIVVPPLAEQREEEIAIEARELTQRFGDFTAVDHVNFRIQRGEIFGFLGSNGCGKTTTMKMLTGLLPATEGEAWLFGRQVDAKDIGARRRVGFMSQAFSLYSELTVHQNLVLHARLFHVPPEEIGPRVEEMVNRFGLGEVLHALPESLPLGVRQRLSLGVAMVHKPEMLILDEPTSGVDPVARDGFWELIIHLARNDRVTIFISTHFMNEGLRCDRISLMHAGKVLVSDPPAEIVRKRGVATLEEAFILYIKDAEAARAAKEGAGAQPTTSKEQAPKRESVSGAAATQPTAQTESATPYKRQHGIFDAARAWSYALRETLELRRDPVRLSLALFGSMLLMIVMGYGLSLDVEDLRFAVLDRDQTTLSHNYTLNLAGSRYFMQRPPINNYEELDHRMKSGEVSLAVEIPPRFAQDAKRGKPVEIGAWIDGAMPQRAETIQGYANGIHLQWLTYQAKEEVGQDFQGSARVEARFRYNPDVKSLPAMVPAVMPLLLLMIPAMLTALSVVREKELGSIINLYVTPVSKAEFLLGKQLPYVAMAMVNFLLMTLIAVALFRVPVKGSFLTLALAAFIFVGISTAMGLFASIFTRTQVAALFLTMIGTLIPASQFAGLINPVSSLEGVGKMIGHVYPASYMFTISRGVFSKALSLIDLYAAFWPMLLALPVLLGLSIALLKKQES